ncbi:MAG TPA: nitrile hydratase accessory protein [Caulobacteraceae bacterium]|nr:nitrile hydratase accessory protein [Caulobacteraceae bacterium]
MNPPEAAEAPFPEATFDEPWQAQAFALTVELHARGALSWPEWSAALGAAIAEAPHAPYYERWLVALERLVLARGFTDSAELIDRKTAWRQAYERTPHGQPVTLEPAGKSNTRT